MPQLTLPFIHGSPTSHAAAESMVEHAETARQRVDDALRKAGPVGLSDEEGIALTGLSPSSYRPRRIECHAVDLGERRKVMSGRFATVWFHPAVVK